MISYTAKQFKLKFGHKPGIVFDLKTHLTFQHKQDAMLNPDIAIIRAEFGTLAHKDLGTIPYCLMVRWWFHEGNMRGAIDNVIIFKNQAELDAYKKNVELRAISLNKN